MTILQPKNLTLASVCDWSNLLDAWRSTARRKRGRQPTADFEINLADNLLQLQTELANGEYEPGPYRHFTIFEPKKRIISAAPFRDRVIHHALCQIIEPAFEQRFIGDSYANRLNKGTHKAVKRFQTFSRHFRFALRLDIVKHFESIDHQILLCQLNRVIKEPGLLALCTKIIESGEQLPSHNVQYLFPGDDLIDLTRPKGLPIGNLTSQFWSNCYLHPLDSFIKRELRCEGYLRYVDDFTLFADSKKQLWQWKQALIAKLSELRLHIHENSAQVTPTRNGIPWLGFVIYPEKILLKARKSVHATRQLRHAWQAVQQNQLSVLAFNAVLRGWLNHASQGDTWGLRRHILEQLPLNAAFWRED